jgi:biotin operon repressor
MTVPTAPDSTAPARPTPADDFERLLTVFKALANESRLRILGILAEGPCSVNALAENLDLKESTVSHHLARLKRVGLVGMDVHGNTHLYHLRKNHLIDLRRELLSPQQLADLAHVDGTDASPERAAEEKILANFLQDGRLRRIPATRKKRDVILRWLVAQLDPERRYPEAELNDVLGRFHPDTATLRRELVGYPLMRREAGVYWRLLDEPTE